MIKNLIKKKGFTLIELLVVVAIVAILSLVAVNTYIDYRRNAILTFVGEELISQIKELKSQVRYGRGQCFGVDFKQEGDEFLVEFFSTDFIDKKVWVDTKWQYTGCDYEELDVKDFRMDEQVFINNLDFINEDGFEMDGFNDVRFSFFPPSGEIDIENDEIEILKVEFSYGEVAKKTIDLNLRKL